MRIEEEVVTETNLPLRIGVKTERRGSALCLTVWIYDNICQSAMAYLLELCLVFSYLWNSRWSYKTRIATASISG